MIERRRSRGKGARRTVTALFASALLASTGCGPGGGAPAANEAASQLCVDTINNHRASIGLGPYQRWADGESCASGEARDDSFSGIPHDAFGTCGEFAQNECPGWPGPPESMIPDCLALMWAEGPGEDFAAHGHYINMSSTSYTEVACGFFETENGEVWSVQNFK